ncbi:hypothetical protein OUZ56_032545 [Daphnia magna]|uniref:Type II secretion system protein GspE N-terminal domain-containing protein n=1 Tax=Daphnia magna TaxID=35525 RepID=A0ABR0B987_9CRUS|nr:hypothetical protein OUZ56_032545 [Daphnia magna]
MLVFADAVPLGRMLPVLRKHAQGTPFLRAILDAEIIDVEELDGFLAVAGEFRATEVIPDAELAARLPPGFLDRFLMVPLAQRSDGTVDVAVADIRDRHAQKELGFQLSSEDGPVAVEPHLATLAAIEAALAELRPRLRATSRGFAPAAEKPAARRTFHTPTWGTPVDDTVRRELEARGVPRISKLGAATPAPPRRATDPHLTRAQSDEWEDAGQALRATTPVPQQRCSVAACASKGAKHHRSWRRAPARLSRDRLLRESPAVAQLALARTRGEVLALLLEGAAEVARRVALFLVRREEGATTLLGQACNGAFGNAVAVAKFRLDAEGDHIFAEALRAGFFLGPMDDRPAHAPFRSAFGDPGPDLALWVVEVARRPVVVLYADDLDTPLLSTRRLAELTTAAAQALVRIVQG